MTTAPKPRLRPHGLETVALPSGAAMPILGMGTWGMGERPGDAAREADALRAGLDAGTTLIDTAEMYGDGAAEEVVGQAIQGRRDAVFLVSKVYPHNASRAACIAACERSLKRLGTDRLDLYLLHWQGSVPFEETLEAFETLRRDGKIIDHGVSNLDTAALKDWLAADSARRTATDQVYYNLGQRGIEWDLLPFCQERGLPVMAYSPYDQGGLLEDDRLDTLAEQHGVSPAVLCIAWLLSRQGLVAIPKSANADRVRETRRALSVRLTDDDLAMLDDLFPPPDGPEDLAML